MTRWPRTGEVLDLEPADAGLRDGEGPGVVVLVERAADHLDPGLAHRALVLLRERCEPEHGARGDRPPQLGERAGTAVVVHQDGQPAVGELGGEVVDQGVDDRADGPVGQDAQDEVAAAGAQGPRGGGRGVAQARGRVPDPLAGGLGDRDVVLAVEDVADGRPRDAALPGDVGTRQTRHGPSLDARQICAQP